MWPGHRLPVPWQTADLGLGRSDMSWIKRNVLPLAVVGLFLSTVLLTAWLLRPALSIPVDADNRTPAFAAALALTGVLVTAGVTLIGILLRHSSDARVAQVAKEAEVRAALDQRRLQMQAAVETVRLLSSPNGSLAPPEQVSAALIVLNKLGERQLALDLAAELWPKDQVSASAATFLCDSAFHSDDEEAQMAAAMLMYNNWQRLRTRSDQVHWVSFSDRWPKTLTAGARSLMAKALEAWLEQSPAEGADFRRNLLREARRLDALEEGEEAARGSKVVVQRGLDA